jgi:hypothetical protein
MYIAHDGDHIHATGRTPQAAIRHALAACPDLTGLDTDKCSRRMSQWLTRHNGEPAVWSVSYWVADCEPDARPRF